MAQQQKIFDVVTKLSPKAALFFRMADPLGIDIVNTNEGERYNVKGMINANALTFEQLEQALEDLANQY